MDILARYLADQLHTDIVVMRLISSMFLGYPIAFIYNLWIKHLGIPCRHLYLLITGLSLSYWNFGVDTIHIFIGIFVTLALNHCFSKTSFAVISSFTFNLGYLVVGSYICNRGTYDINWTTQYCILCLRLIGLSWDLFDSTKPESARSVYQKRYALSNIPGVLEALAFCFTPTAMLIGPQFPMRHFQAFIDGSLQPRFTSSNGTFAERFIYNDKVRRTVIRFVLGLTGVIALSQLLNFYPAEKMLTDEFQTQWTFVNRLIYMIVFSQLILLRYVAVWLIGEGACVLLGLGCTGFVHLKTKQQTQPSTVSTATAGAPDAKESRCDGPVLKRRDSAIDWWSLEYDEIKNLTNAYNPSQIEFRDADHTACANVSVNRYLLATNTDDLVAGFNINTNRWVLEYVYKRLRFLGNKTLSQILALMFLALWHGTYSGYFVNFACEFLTVAVEKDFLAIVKRSGYKHFLYETFIGKVLTTILGKMHILFLLTCPLTVFHFLQFKYWYPVMKSVYFVGMIYVLWPIARPVAKFLFPPTTTDRRPKPHKLYEDSLSNGGLADKVK